MDLEYSELVGRTIVAVDSPYGAPVLVLDDGRTVTFHKEEDHTDELTGTYWPGTWTLELISSPRPEDIAKFERRNYELWVVNGITVSRRERGRRKNTPMDKWREMGMPT